MENTCLYPAFEAESKKEQVDTYPSSQSNLQPNVLFFPLCLPPTFSSAFWKKKETIDAALADGLVARCSKQLFQS